MYITLLRVKRNTLAAEARIIRREEKRFAKGRRQHPTFVALNSHRRTILRRTARHNHLAAMFLKEKPYCVAEEYAWKAGLPDFDEILKVALRFSLKANEREVRQKFAQWQDDAKEYFEAVRTSSAPIVDVAV